MRTAVTVGVLAFALIAPGLPAATIEIGPTADFRNTMKGLQPGDTLILDGGTYSFSGYFELDIAGTSGQPILIQARSGQQPVIAYNGTDQNIRRLAWPALHRRQQRHRAQLPRPRHRGERNRGQ
jgi:hypothetical protein